MHLTNLPVTSRALKPGPYVRLVGVKRIGLRLDPVDSPPRRLLFAFGVSGQLLNFRALGLDRFVTAHTGRYVWNRRVRRLVHIFVAKRAFELWSFFSLFRDVLPVVKLDGLFRRFRLTRRTHEQHADQNDRQRNQD